MNSTTTITDEVATLNRSYFTKMKRGTDAEILKNPVISTKDKHVERGSRYYVIYNVSTTDFLNVKLGVSGNFTSEST